MCDPAGGFPAGADGATFREVRSGEPISRRSVGPGFSRHVWWTDERMISVNKHEQTQQELGMMISKQNWHFLFIQWFHIVLETSIPTDVFLAGDYQDVCRVSKARLAIPFLFGAFTWLHISCQYGQYVYFMLFPFHPLDNAQNGLDMKFLRSSSLDSTRIYQNHIESASSWLDPPQIFLEATDRGGLTALLWASKEGKADEASGVWRGQWKDWSFIMWSTQRVYFWFIIRTSSF